MIKPDAILKPAAIPKMPRWTTGERIVTPISQLLIRDGALQRFHDPDVFPFAGRLRAPLGDISVDDDELAIANLWRAKDGGPLRTFSGGLAHENGWHHSLKAGAMLGWEGEAAYELLVAAESEHSVVKIGAETAQFDFVHNGRHHVYTIDVELTDEDGNITFVEVKRSERDLADDNLRLVLAYVAEVCRRIGIRFLIVFRDQIYRNRMHRRNAHLVYSRVFIEPSVEHLVRLQSHAERTGGSTTRGALAAALFPDRPVFGRALVDALIVRRCVRMDLAVRVNDASPVLVV